MAGAGSETASDGSFLTAGRGDQARVLIGSSLGSYIQMSTLIIYPFGVLASAIASSFAVGVADISRLIGPALIVTIVAQPITGWIVNRWSPRTVSISALGLLGASMLILSFSPARPVAFGVCLAVATLLSCLATPNVYGALVSECFERRRGLALGTMMSFTGLATATIPLLTSLLLHELGWRGVYRAFAVVAGLLCLLNAVLLPVGRARRARAGAESARDIILRAAREPIFWNIATVFFLLSIAANALPIFLPLLLRGRGASPEIAAASLTMVGLMMIVSRPILGFLIDRWPVRGVLAAILIGPMIGAVALLMTTGIAAAVIAASGFGVAVGGEFVCLSFLVAKVFGTRHFGLLYGWLAVALAGGVALGPIVVARLSRGADYHASLIFILASAAAALVVVMLGLGRGQIDATAMRRAA